MKITIGSRRFEALLVAMLACTCGAARAAGTEASAAGGTPQLAWTPHRAAAAPAAATVEESAPTAPQATGSPPALQAVPGAAATVHLPDGVPPVEALRSRAAAPAAGRPKTALPTQPRRPSVRSASPDSILGVDVFRTPSRGVARPILADESPESAARGFSRGAIERLGGGLAPRFDGGRRPERLAASVDALPSVMRQQPRSAPADAADAGPVEAITTPAPRESGSPMGDSLPGAIEFMDPADAGGMSPEAGPDGLMLGEYPPQLHVESFYDDPYACEDDDPLCYHSGKFCAWFRRFGRPYYGWRWYRDFTAGAGVVAFTNDSDFALNGNFGFDEFLNQGMPFWNAFGVGWQVGARATQTNFQGSTIDLPGGPLQRGGRDQVFVTTGFFTRAFEGRGLQGGAVWDYLHDNWYDSVDLAQIRYELSYVWGYHEVGFWGASNVADELSIFGADRQTSAIADTLDLYTAFYRIQFGDANEWKVWGGATGYGDGIIGSVVRAPMARCWALEGAAMYMIPSKSQTIDIDGAGTTYTYAPAAWNVGVNLVFYPGGRSRRSLASPYRPLFDVADTGTMIRRLGILAP